MKKLILFLALMLTIVIASAQTFKAPSRSKQPVKADTTTTYRYEVKDTVYTVLPKEVQIQMGRKYKED